ncbi:MAG: hypothetical protein GWN58_32925 [Anaerolineae bacterium]|nr:hypothetical protein [Thermoplasmata archaeon]NIV34079.1 hypothetical protein [Anaerolineae bacterium]NIY05930.1 hypothetical protein [Thermoplasmata archaeon]
MERIGIARGRPKGPTNRRDEYGIYAMTEAYGRPVDPPKLYLKYEGYREQRPDGEAQVGLPMGGPGWRPEPMIDFHPDERVRDFGPGEPRSVSVWETIRFFKDGPWRVHATE